MEPNAQQVVPQTPFHAYLSAGVSQPMAIAAPYDFVVSTLHLQAYSSGDTRFTLTDSGGSAYFDIVVNSNDPDHGTRLYSGLAVTLQGGASYTLESDAFAMYVVVAGFYVTPQGASIL